MQISNPAGAGSEKIPPQNIEAERSTLGSMLLDRDAIGRVFEILTDDAFYVDAHRRIFRAILDLYDRNEPVDYVTLTDLLARWGDLEKLGGAAYLTQLTDSVPTSAHAEHYARIVKEKFILRNLIRVSTEVVSRCYTAEEDADRLLDEAERSIFELSQNRQRGAVLKVKDIIHDAMEMVENLSKHETHITGVPTGYPELDEMTSGLQPGELVILAARPSMGKTALCLNLASNAALQGKTPVAIFSLEMSAESLVTRMLCSEARVNIQDVRTGRLGEGNLVHLSMAAGRLFDSDVFIDDSPSLNILELRSKARRLKAEHNIGLVIVDYIQMMQGVGKQENRQQEISNISRSFKALAKELKAPVMVLSQLSRAPEARGDRRPQLSDLRESGAIEQDADVVMFIYREAYYEKDKKDDRTAELIIAKQRNGPTGTIKLIFNQQYTRFDAMASPRMPGGVLS
ncbi:MAG: replicative DNA helicase [Candidatus Firestonebacteria bacterium]|nr:replicative DNA helicase [Candidatus Firestonebacteria bacterium]